MICPDQHPEPGNKHDTSITDQTKSTAHSGNEPGVTKRHDSHTLDSTQWQNAEMTNRQAATPQSNQRQHALQQLRSGCPMPAAFAPHECRHASAPKHMPPGRLVEGQTGMRDACSVMSICVGTPRVHQHVIWMCDGVGGVLWWCFRGTGGGGGGGNA